MKIVSLNIRGVGDSEKKRWVKTIIRSERPDIFGIQETKCGLVEDNWVENIWGGGEFGFSQSLAVGNSGGIILIWNKQVFTCKDAIINERFIALRGSWIGKRRMFISLAFMVLILLI